MNQEQGSNTHQNHSIQVQEIIPISISNNKQPSIKELNIIKKRSSVESWKGQNNNRGNLLRVNQRISELSKNNSNLQISNSKKKIKEKTNDKKIFKTDQDAKKHFSPELMKNINLSQNLLEWRNQQQNSQSYSPKRAQSDFQGGFEGNIFELKKCLSKDDELKLEEQENSRNMNMFGQIINLLKSESQNKQIIKRQNSQKNQLFKRVSKNTDHSESINYSNHTISEHFSEYKRSSQEMSSNQLKNNSSVALGTLKKINKKETLKQSEKSKLSSSNVKLKKGSGDNIGNEIEEFQDLISFGEQVNKPQKKESQSVISKQSPPKEQDYQNFGQYVQQKIQRMRKQNQGLTSGMSEDEKHKFQIQQEQILQNVIIEMYEEMNNKNKLNKQQADSMKSLERLGSIDSCSVNSPDYKQNQRLHFPKKAVKKRITDNDNHGLNFGALQFDAKSEKNPGTIKDSENSQVSSFKFNNNINFDYEPSNHNKEESSLQSQPNQSDMMMMLKLIISNLKIKQPRKRNTVQFGKKESKIIQVKQRNSCLDNDKLLQMHNIKQCNLNQIRKNPVQINQINLNEVFDIEKPINKQQQLNQYQSPILDEINANKNEQQQKIKQVLNRIKEKQVKRTETILLCKGLSLAGMSVYKKEQYINNKIKNQNQEKLMISNQDINLSKTCTANQPKQVEIDEPIKIINGPNNFNIQDRSQIEKFSAFIQQQNMLNHQNKLKLNENMQKLIQDLNLKGIIETESENNVSVSQNNLVLNRFKQKLQNSQNQAYLDSKGFSALLGSSMVNGIISHESNYSQLLNHQIEKISEDKSKISNSQSDSKSKSLSANMQQSKNSQVSGSFEKSNQIKSLINDSQNIRIHKSSHKSLETNMKQKQDPNLFYLDGGNIFRIPELDEENNSSFMPVGSEYLQSSKMQGKSQQFTPLYQFQHARKLVSDQNALKSVINWDKTGNENDSNQSQIIPKNKMFSSGGSYTLQLSRSLAPSASMLKQSNDVDEQVVEECENEQSLKKLDPQQQDSQNNNINELIQNLKDYQAELLDIKGLKCQIKAFITHKISVNIKQIQGLKCGQEQSYEQSLQENTDLMSNEIGLTEEDHNQTEIFSLLINDKVNKIFEQWLKKYTANQDVRNQTVNEQINEDSVNDSTIAQFPQSTTINLPIIVEQQQEDYIEQLYESQSSSIHGLQQEIQQANGDQLLQLNQINIGFEENKVQQNQLISIDKNHQIAYIFICILKSNLKKNMILQSLIANNKNSLITLGHSLSRMTPRIEKDGIMSRILGSNSQLKCQQTYYNQFNQKIRDNLKEKPDIILRLFSKSGKKAYQGRVFLNENLEYICFKGQRDNILARKANICSCFCFDNIKNDQIQIKIKINEIFELKIGSNYDNWKIVLNNLNKNKFSPVQREQEPWKFLMIITSNSEYKFQIFNREDAIDFQVAVHQCLNINQLKLVGGFNQKSSNVFPTNPAFIKYQYIKIKLLLIGDSFLQIFLSAILETMVNSIENSLDEINFKLKGLLKLKLQFTRLKLKFCNQSILDMLFLKKYDLKKQQRNSPTRTLNQFETTYAERLRRFQNESLQS